MSNGGLVSGQVSQGAAPLYTPEQLARVRSQVSRSPFYIETDYNLRIYIVNSIAGQVVNFVVRLMSLDGNRKLDAFTATPPANRSVFLVEHQLTEGFLYGVTAYCTGQFVDVGTCFVQCKLVQGTGQNRNDLVTLFSGYCTADQDIGWPYAVQPVSTRIGVWRSIVGTVPAAGVNINETCPTGARWDVAWVNLTLTTDAVVATRKVRLIFTIAGSDVIVCPSNFTQAAGLIQGYLFGQSFPFSTNTYTALIYTTNPMPFTPTLYGGDGFRGSTDFIDAGDTFQAPRYLVLEQLRVQ